MSPKESSVRHLDPLTRRRIAALHGVITTLKARLAARDARIKELEAQLARAEARHDS